jgi:hypothetical protein
MNEWKAGPEILLDQIAAVRDEYKKLRRDLLDQMEFLAGQGESAEVGELSTEAERYGSAILACSRIIKIVDSFRYERLAERAKAGGGE